MSGAKPIYERLSSMSKAKLDKLEFSHRQHLTRFIEAKNGKSDLIQRCEDKQNRLIERAKKECESSLPLAMGTAMELRKIKADILIAKSVMTLIRSNVFYHRLMVILIQDTKAGVEYDPSRVKDLIPQEFSDMFEQSILSTNLEGLLGDLKKELDQHASGGDA